MKKRQIKTNLQIWCGKIKNVKTDIQNQKGEAKDDSKR